MYNDENNNNQQMNNGEYRYSYTNNNGANNTNPGNAYNQKPHKQKKKMPYALKIVASAVSFGLIAGVVFQGVNVAGNYFLGKNGSSSTGISTTSGSGSGADISTTQLTTSTSTIEATDTASVAEECMPSIVSITNVGVQEVQSYFGGGYEQQFTSAGSGIIIGENDSELLIVTNNHVIEDSNELTVTFIDEESVEATVKGADSSKDIAVIAVKLDDIKDSTKDQIKIATLGDSDSVVIGQDVVDIGNALGYGQSVTAGIISALDRDLDSLSLEGLIQTDAAINPGNSGGALLNSAGEVIGINVAKAGSTSTTSVEAMGYAIPISDVKDLIEDMMNRETREVVDEDEQGILGVSISTISSQQAESYGMPTGAYVSKVMDGYGAEAAGIQKGDIITSIEGMSVSSVEDLKEQLTYYKAGETVTVTIQRIQSDGEYESMDVDVTLQKES